MVLMKSLVGTEVEKTNWNVLCVERSVRAWSIEGVPGYAVVIELVLC